MSEQVNVSRELIEALCPAHPNQIFLRSGILYVPDKRIELTCVVPAGQHANSDIVPVERYVRCALHGTYVLTGALIRQDTDVIDRQAFENGRKRCARTYLEYPQVKKLDEPFGLEIRLSGVRRMNDKYFGFFDVKGPAAGEVVIVIE
jgi:hypothetical protein